MKQVSLLLLITLPFLFAGCKKDDVDPRDQYVGTYNLKYVGVQQMNGGSAYSVGGTGILKVSKGSNANELIFQDNDTYSVKLSGSTFVIPPYTAKISIGKNDYNLYTEGSGAFSQDILTYSETSSGSGIMITHNVTGTK